MSSSVNKRPRSVSECIAMEAQTVDQNENKYPMGTKTPITKGEQLITDALIERPDGGWGWVVVMAVFVNSIIFDGIMFGAGQALIPVWTKYFNVSPASVSLIFSLQSSFYFFAGPISGAFVNQLGCRWVSIAGGLLAAIGFILSTFATSVEYLYASYGFVTGLGLGTLFLCGIIVISEYFESKRSLATGIAVCGSGVGTFVFPPFFTYLVENQSWNHTMLLIGAVELHCLIFSALFRPLSPKKKQLEQVQETLACILQAEASDEQDPTADGLPAKKSRTTSTDNRSDSVFTDVTTEADENPRQRFVRGIGQLTSVRSSFARQMPTRQQSLILDVDKALQSDEQSLRKLSYASIRSFNRPMDRFDVLYPGGMRTLSEVSSKDEAKPKPEVVEDVLSAIIEEQHKSWFDSIQTAAKDMINIRLLKNPSFVLFVFSCVLTTIGFYVPYLYLPSMAEQNEVPSEMASMLLSIIGITNTLSRVVCGWVADRPGVDCIVITNCANMLAGIATMLAPHLHSYPLLVIYSLCFGAGIGGLMSMRSLVTVKLIGIKNLTSAFGLTMLFMGFSVFLGPPLAASMYEITGTYQLSFYISGGLMAAGGLVGVALKMVYSRQQTTAKQTDAPSPAGKSKFQTKLKALSAKIHGLYKANSST